MVPVPVQLCEGAPDSTGCRQGPGVLLLYGAGAAGPDEFQRRLLHSCSCKRPGGVRSAAVHVLVGTPGPGGAAGGSHTHSHCFLWKMTEGRGLWASLGLLILVYIHMGVIYAHVCGAAAGHSSVEPGRLRGKCGDGLPLAAGADADRDAQTRTEEPQSAQAARRPGRRVEAQNPGSPLTWMSVYCVGVRYCMMWQHNR